MKSPRPQFHVGERLTVSIEKIAHGGHFIARHEGQVFFVRHAIPGESVEIEITGTGSSFLRADVVKVITPSPDRVSPPCSYSRADGCGGCDFQHISIVRQRQLKGDVIREQFSRIAKMEIEIEVEEVGSPLHWRTRISSATNNRGEIGFYASRSHSVVPVKDCLIAAESIKFPELAKRTWPRESRIEISASSEGIRSVAIAPAGRGSKSRLTEGPQVLTEMIAGHSVEVSQRSFWQSHDLAPEILTQAVGEDVREGDHLLDLYGGVGLFTAALLDRVGAHGHIDLVESSQSATADARRNFANFPNVSIITGDVLKELSRISRADVVLLDPPREGAGKETVAAIVDLRPRSILYVACDPAALARDTAYLAEIGYEMASLRAFDLFPMTHHVECVARFEPFQK
ncbi:MAG: TRAM domain-containing protein [Candidatus Nanopelagicaceae bacterium]|nr:TRAM domain-containing protein [Candidatus Nanopelagicaceae bacterium]